MKKIVTLAAFVLLLQVLWIGSAFAEYQSSGDITLSVTVAEDQLETSDSTGEATFEAQEGVHATLYDSTGQQVDHSYVWIEVNGEKVLAIDPPQPWMN